MDRPGLKRLLEDVAAGRVNVIVVYKVDRLTRSLADFARIVSILDTAQASFVSVTQAFNTTTSMGRLTLNVLLSFAQFEREVTGERIRDKIAASKQKGIWMGGPLPLGYRVEDHKLVIVEAEAEKVRKIMRSYLGSPSINALLTQLATDEVCTKEQQRADGSIRGGIPFRRGGLIHLLKNPLYCGLISHKGQSYPGNHDPIIDVTLWNAVQDKLKAQAPNRNRETNAPQEGLLRGLLTDPEGRTMVPGYAVRGARRYRYYETRRDLVIADSPHATRIPLNLLEVVVTDTLVRWLKDATALQSLCSGHSGAVLKAVLQRSEILSRLLAKPGTRHQSIEQLVRTISLSANQIRISINLSVLSSDSDVFTTSASKNNQEQDNAAKQDDNHHNQDENKLHVLIAERPQQKYFRETKLCIGSVQNSIPTKPDAKLIALLRDAYHVRQIVMASPDQTLTALAKVHHRCRRTLATLLALSWLSARIVRNIIEGTQPRALTHTKLLSIELPIDWVAQEKLLGFAQQ
jgi:site-specific DNA recombinase